MTLVHGQPLDRPPLDPQAVEAALARLVSQQVLSPEQALAVARELVSDPVLAQPTPAPSAVPAAGAVPGGASPLRARLVEASAYLGAVLVGAGLLAMVAQSWDSLAVSSRVAVVLGLGLTSYAAGLVVSLLTAGGRVALRRHPAAPRRRVASVLLTAGSVLVATAVPVSLDATTRSVGLSCLVALVLLVPAQRLSPSAVSEIALFGASALGLGTALGELVPPRPDSEAYLYGPPSARAWDYLVPVALLVLGLLWAMVVSRLLTLPVVATVLGLLLALGTAIGLTADQPTRPAGLLTLAVLTVLGVVVFVRERGWPWLVLTVLSATLAVFVLVSDAGNPALAFLASGVVLLATAGDATLLGRRRAAARA